VPTADFVRLPITLSITLLTNRARET